MTRFILASIIFLISADTSQIIPDDYPVTNNMLLKSSATRCINGVYSFDKAWFKNTRLNQFLVFELYTDFHRLAIYHARRDFVFPEFIRRIELQVKKGVSVYEPADDSVKTCEFKNFIDSATEINPRYFQTKQGTALGISKNRAIKRYGIPNNTQLLNTIEICRWDFHGDQIAGNSTKIGSQPIAVNSYGYHLSMFFKSDTLVATIIENDIP